MSSLRLGTRGSALALAQSTQVAESLRDVTGREVVLVKIRSVGDDLVGPLSRAPQPGVFVSALRDALLGGEVDLVVHSMKDLPAAPVLGITTVAVPRREEPWDALITREGCSLAALPAGSIVGTSSPRRTVQLRHTRPDLSIVDLRGNIDSRIQRVRSGEVDAAVLALAGLRRIGREDEVDEILTQTLPAPAQGALAIEIRSDDLDLFTVLKVLDCPESRRQVVAERAVLAGLAATCTSAVAAIARSTDANHSSLVLHAEVGPPVDRSAEPVRGTLASIVELGDEQAAHDLGTVLSRMLLADGAGTLLDDSTWSPPPHNQPVVWVTRPSSGARADVQALRSRGLTVLEAPVLQTSADPNGTQAAERTLLAIERDSDVLALTSAAAVRALVELTDDDSLRSALAVGQARGLQVVVVGKGTADSVRRLGIEDVLVPPVQDSEGMLDLLGDRDPGRAILPRGNIAMRGLAEGLQARGWTVLTEQVYRTESVPPPVGVAKAASCGAVDAIVVRSPSGVRATRDALESVTLPQHLVLVAGGSTTAAAIESEWPDRCGHFVVTPEPSAEAVAETVAQACGAAS